MALEALFEITRFPAFLEALVENPHYREVLVRPLEIILEAEQQPLIIKDWISFWENPRRHEGPSLSPGSWRLLSQFGPAEAQVILRWLLDRIAREYGTGRKRRGIKTALDLFSVVLHELARETPPETFQDLLEQYLALAQEPLFASDLYQWLFSCSFDPEKPGLDAYLLAVQGLDKALLAKDGERIGWNAYNLITYYSFFDAAEAERLLEAHLKYLQDDRYYDALGNIALKLLDDGKIVQGKAYLQAVWHFTQRFSAQDSLAELRSIGFNLVYYALNLAWEHFDDKAYTLAIPILRSLLEILQTNQQEFLEASRDLGTRPVDWAYQYFVHLAECHLRLQASHAQLGQEERAQDLQTAFEHLKLTCPYDLESIAQDFYRDRDQGD